MKTTFLPPGTVDRSDLSYVVIGAREGENWIFVRHRDRRTWELPAGHIEEGENPTEAARRELWEESGARGSLVHLADYCVREDGNTGYGCLFLVRVEEREPLPGFEIAELKLSGEPPGKLTYGEVQEVLFRRLEMSLLS